MKRTIIAQGLKRLGLFFTKFRSFAERYPMSRIKADGCVWHSGDGTFAGWAWDPGRPKEIAEVIVFLNGRRVASVFAESPAFDDACPFEASFRGFEYKIPSYYCSGKVIHIAFKLICGKELVGSPLVIEPKAKDAPADSFSMSDITLIAANADKDPSPHPSGDQSAIVFYSLRGLELVESIYKFETSDMAVGGPRAHQVYQPWFPYAASIKNVFVDIDHGTIFLPDGRVWQSTTYLRDPLTIKTAQTRIARRDIDGEISEGVALVRSAMAWNYFHWHLDCLASWYGVKTIFGKNVPVASPPLSETQARSFSLLAGTQPINKTGLHFCNEVMVGSAFDGRGIFPDRNTVSMFESIAAASSCKTSECGPFLFISRKDAAHRALQNEDELFEKLAPIGFQRVLLSTLSYDKQIVTFRDARCIVATHGAGLTNIGFCRAGCKVFEIIPRSYVNGCFRFLAAAKDLVHLWYPTLQEDPFLVSVDEFMRYFHANFRSSERRIEIETATN